MPAPPAPSWVPQVSGPKDLVGILSPIAQQFSPKGNWAIRVIPDTSWRHIAEETELGRGHSTYAMSDLASGMTYLKESAIRNNNPVVIQRILAHEMGHLTLQTDNEDKAEGWAHTWLKKNKT